MAYYTAYSELVTYFKALPTSVTDLKSVTVGQDEEDLNLQNSQIQYPHLRVETPELRYLNEDQNMEVRYNFRLFVLTGEPLKTNDAANAALSSTELIMRKVLKRLWTDADAGLFDVIQGDKDADAVRAWSGDNVFGWWARVTLSLWDPCVV